MKLARALLGIAGALTLTTGGTAALADDPTQIRLSEVYEMTPGVSATHQVTLSTSEPLISEQCQSMGTAAKATSSLLVTVDGVDSCRFTWELEDGGAEVVSVDDGGVFHFESTSARLLGAFSSPDASATIESVTLVAHASFVAEASEGGQISNPGASTKIDASTVTWRDVTGDVSATGTVDADVSSATASPTPSPSPSVSPQGRGHGSTAGSLAPIAAITAGVLALAVITGLLHHSKRSRQAAADAQFDREAALRKARLRAASAEKSAAAPYGKRSLSQASSGRDETTPTSPQPPASSGAETDDKRFRPPDLA